MHQAFTGFTCRHTGIVGQLAQMSQGIALITLPFYEQAVSQAVTQSLSNSPNASPSHSHSKARRPLLRRRFGEPSVDEPDQKRTLYGKGLSRLIRQKTSTI